MDDFFTNYFDTLSKKICNADSLILKDVAERIQRIALNGKKIIVVGNGGSAAMASHVTVDLTKAAGIRAVNFNEADLLTCFSNDYGYENWVTKALEFYADPGDLAILISSSGKSSNILNGALKAKAMDIVLVTLSGFAKDNTLRQLGDLNLWVDSSEYNIVEMTHHVWLLAMIDYLTEAKANQ